MKLHYDLISIIFAYCGFYRRRQFIYISANYRRVGICQSYAYFISLDGLTALDILIAICKTDNILSPANLDIARYCLKNPQIKPEYSSNFAFRQACRNGHLEIVRLLLETKRIDAGDFDSDAIIQGAAGGHLEIVQLLIDAGADPSAQNNKAIERAIENNHLEVVIYLYHQSMDILELIRGCIFYANRNKTMEQFLLSKTYDSCFKYLNAIYYFGIATKPEILAQFTEFLHRPNWWNPSQDYNVVIIIASQEPGLDKIGKILLADSRVDPSARYNAAIFLASQNGNIEMVKLLLADPRVDPSVHDNYPIKISVSEKHYEIVELLLADSRVNPSAQDNCAIYQACHMGNLRLVKLLLAHPLVNPSARNNAPLLECIRTHGCMGAEIQEIVRLLYADPRVRNTIGTSTNFIESTDIYDIIYGITENN